MLIREYSLRRVALQINLLRSQYPRATYISSQIRNQVKNYLIYLHSRKSQINLQKREFKTVKLEQAISVKTEIYLTNRMLLAFNIKDRKRVLLINGHWFLPVIKWAWQIAIHIVEVEITLSLLVGHPIFPNSNL